MPKKVQWEPIELDEVTHQPKYGYLINMQDFIDSCKCGMFIDYDGYGEYATKNMVSDIKVRPSDYFKGKLRTQFSFVLWYNR